VTGKKKQNRLARKRENSREKGSWWKKVKNREREKSGTREDARGRSNDMKIIPNYKA